MPDEPTRSQAFRTTGVMPYSSEANNRRGHRADLEGLRGLALTLVLLFHFDVPPFSGGFIGVDVFFVLSGYLISRSTKQSLHNATFSLSAFYMRRIVRLAPALIVTLVVFTMASVAIFPFLDARDTAQSAAAALLGVSNVSFFFRSGYFDTTAAKKPLLHTWSLGIETLFYTFWPPLHLLLYWLHKALPVTFAVLFTAISIVRAEQAALYTPHAAFFLLHHRAWEFFIGVILALRVHPIPVKSSSRLSEIVSLTGLIALVSASTIYDPTNSFPGARALIPCLSTAAMISTKDTVVARFVLSMPQLRALGRVSYSVYLVHWPLLIHLRAIRSWAPLAPMELFIGFLVAIFGGCVLHFLIERPFMARREFGNVRTFFLKFIALVIALLAAFLSVFFLLDEKDRIAKSNALRDLTSTLDPKLKFGGISPAAAVQLATLSMSAEAWIPVTKLSRELILRPCVPPALRVAIIGDSHAANLEPLAVHLRETFDAEVQLWVLPACPPLLGVRKIFVTDIAWDEPCQHFKSMWIDRVAKEKFDAVLLAARWESNLYRHPSMESSENKPPTSTLLVKPNERREEAFRQGLEHGRNYSRSLFGPALQATARTIAMSGAIPVLFSQVPLLPFDPRTCRKANDSCQGEPALVAMRQLKFINEAIQRAAKAVPGTRAVVPFRYFCDGVTACKSKMGDAFLYEDNNHLSFLGGAYLTLRWRQEGYSGISWKKMMDNRSTASKFSHARLDTEQTTS